MMNKITTVIFDMDGTVLNTLDDLTASVNHVLAEYGFAGHDASEYRKYFGNGIRYALGCAVPNGTDQRVIDEMVPVFKEYYDVHCLDNTRPYDGIMELLRDLGGQGYKLAIVSNKIDSAVKELNTRFFSEYVSVAIGERVGVNRKPEPDTVIQALKELDSTKDEAVYVGDSEVDLKTAANAGLHCISVLWGFRDKEMLQKQGATIFADTPEDVLDIIKRSQIL